MPAIAMCVFAMLLTAGQAGAEEWRRAIGETMATSVVAVVPNVERAAVNLEEPEGTGFAVDDGTLVLTADHVLGAAETARLRLGDGRELAAKILVRDRDTDLALLRPARPVPPLVLGGPAVAGDDVCVAGNSFGLGVSLACGIVSATDVRGIGFNRIEDFVQIDAAVNPGMSGAPVFSRDGAVIGMASAIFTKGSDGNLGVNFAASARLLQVFLADARDGRIDRASQGLLLRAADATETGALIARVIGGSPEDGTDIRAGDRLVSINGIAVRDQADYLFAVMMAAPATRYAFLRDGREMTAIVEMKAE
jgi:S1-C subfamily serine protease